MNPAIWKLIRDYMSVSRGDKYKVDPETEAFNKAQDAYDEWLGSGGEPEYSQSWRVLQRAMAEEQEGMEAAMQEGVPSDLEDSILSDLVALDQRELMLDNVGIYEKNDPVYVKIESERTKLIKQLEGEKGKKERKTKKLKKSSKGHSRFGRGGGGYLPSDLSGSLKDDSIKSRILGHRRKPWS